MRLTWAIFKTCFAASILGATVGVMSGLFIVMLAFAMAPGVMDITKHAFALPLIVLGTTALGAVIAAAYCRVVVKASPDEWLGPQDNVSYCTSCRYDLLHNSTGHCPECGKAIPEEQLRFIASCSEDPSHA